jgi:hypothetical protein
MYPFRYYWRASSDHVFDVEFHDIPTATERLAMARWMSVYFNRGAIRLCPEPLRWCRRWLRFSAQVQWQSDENDHVEADYDWFFDRVSSLFQQLRHIVPIAQVSATGPERYGAEWDDSSRAIQPPGEPPRDDEFTSDPDVERACRSRVGP